MKKSLQDILGKYSALSIQWSLTKILGFVFYLALLVGGLFAFNSSSHAQEALSEATLQKIVDVPSMRRAIDEAKGERIRVIVEYKIPEYSAPLNATNYEKAELLRTKNRAAFVSITNESLGNSDSLLNGPLSSEYQLKGTELIPHLYAKLRIDEIERLAANPNVTKIQSDFHVNVNLNESVPIVYEPTINEINLTGAGRTIAIIDTGVRKTHEFLGSSRVVWEACFSTHDPVKNYESLCPFNAKYSSAPGSADDCALSEAPQCEHGTRVAGIAAGYNTDHQSGEPQRGMASEVKIIAINVFTKKTDDCHEDGGIQSPCLVALNSDIDAALAHVLWLSTQPWIDPIDAINMSIGSVRTDVENGTNHCNHHMLKTNIDKLLDSGIGGIGIATVISAGNGALPDNVWFPACITSAVTVAASTDADEIWLDDVDPDNIGTNWSFLVDLVAPGANITHSVISDCDDIYCSDSGTSLAAPHVTGAIAMLRERFPTSTIAQIVNALRSTGQQILPNDGPPATDNLPRQRIDVAAACRALGNCRQEGQSSAPPYDDFVNADTHGVNSINTMTNIASTSETGEPQHHSPAVAPINSVWAKFTPSESGTQTIKTFGSNFDTIVAVYTGSSVVGLTQVASDDDNGIGNSSSLIFQVIAGTTYHVAYDGKNSETGTIEIEYTFASSPTDPANDDFANAFEISAATGMGTNINATGEIGEPNHNTSNVLPLNSAWWKYTPSEAGSITIDTFGSSFDTVVAVYTGATVSNLTPVASNDDSNYPSVLQSQVTFTAEAGTTYYIAVDGFGANTGTINWAYTFIPASSLDLTSWPIGPRGRSSGEVGDCPAINPNPPGCFFLNETGEAISSTTWRDVSIHQGHSDPDLGNKWHLGADYNLGTDDSGQPVYPFASGTIVKVCKDNASCPGWYASWGNIIFVDHGPVVSIYAHVDWIDPANPPVVDTIVSSDVQFAKVGNANGIYGYHLHFEIRDKSLVSTGEDILDPGLGTTVTQAPGNIGPQGQIDPNSYITDGQDFSGHPPPKVDTEFQINTTTDGKQYLTSVASLKDGGFVVVWVSVEIGGSIFDIYGQRYGADGQKAGSEFNVNLNTVHGPIDTSSSSSAVVAGLENGGFVVVWTSREQSGGQRYSIHGQRYGIDGSKTGIEEFQVSSFTTGDQHRPTVTGLKDGGFAVAWGSFGPDGDGWGVYGQRFTANGSKTGINEFRVNTNTSNWQQYPSITGLEDGGFVITWQSGGQDNPVWSWGIYGQRYHPNGSTTGYNEFLINSYTTLSQFAPSVTALTDGGFVVAWQSEGQDGDSYGIFGQRFHSDGTTAGLQEFPVNIYTTIDQRHASVAGLKNGKYAVAWTSNGQDESSWGVFAQHFGADGVATGSSDIAVNSYTVGEQALPAVTGLEDGRFVVTWHSDEQDGSQFGVFGQIFSDGPVPSSAPVNDDFTNAIMLSSATNTDSGTATNVAATGETGEPNHQTSAVLPLNSVWWKYTPSESGSLTINTYGSNFDTLIAVYTGIGVNSLSQVTSNDDSAGGLQSQVTFDVSVGTTYYVAIDGYGSATGSITWSYSFIPPPIIVASVLPNARATQTGGTVTAFANIYNAGTNTATDCSIALPAPISGTTFLYQTVDGSNIPTGTVNTPVSIAPSTLQGFFFAFTPSTPVSTNIALVFDCTNSEPVPTIWGVNSFALTGSATPIADMISVAATIGNTGYITLPGNMGVQLATVTALNLGSTRTVTASVTEQAINGTDPNMPANLFLCLTDAVGTCLSGYGTSHTFTAGAGLPYYFTMLVGGTGFVADNPALNRVHLYFDDAGNTVGATSVGLRTGP